MAIQYRLLQNKIKGSKNYKKYYAHTVKNGVVRLEDIEDMIASKCTASPGDVRLVVRELFDAVKVCMQFGCVVDLRELGKFHISVKSVCVDDPKEFNPNVHITGYKCNYTTEGKRYKSGKTGKKLVHRDLLEGCKAIEVTHY